MKNYFFIVTSVFVISLSLLSCGEKPMLTITPVDLVVSEGFSNPIGFYDSEPTFSWKLPANIKSQSAYRIVAASSPELLPEEADLWDTQKEESSQSVWVAYKGKDLSSRQKVYWQVMFWDQDGNASAWGEMAHFEMGLLDNMDWKGQWISLEKEENIATDERGGVLYKPEYLRKDFNVSEAIQQARLYITAKGIFQAELNGEKVGNDLFTPGYTPYSKRIETLTYDVTKQLETGKNTLGILLGEGWYSGRLGWSEDMWTVKPLPQALCQLEITYENGKTETIVSDSNWKGNRMGPIRFSGYYDGEVYDANLEMPGWSTADFDAAAWETVKTEDLGNIIKLVPKRHSAVTFKQELATQVVKEVAKGVAIFDLGQNMVGVPRLNIPVLKNQKVTVRFAEMLDNEGKMFTENYRTAKSTNYYTPSANGTVTWQPTFTFHGFRYVELSGFDASKTPDASWVTGLVQYSDFEKAGTFTSSHKKLNQLQQNIEWGMKGNFLDIPTDCPQRDERMGWTGDAQVFAPTSMFLGDVHSFWMSWLQSMREDQDDEGGIPFVVPNPMGKKFSSGWADAATVIPWEIYFRTGDKGVLEENYDMMRKLVGYYKSKSRNHIVKVNTFGDWLQPLPVEESNQRGDTPKDLIGTAYYARSIQLTLKAAKVLRLDEDVAELKELFANVSQAFEDKYIDKDGKLTTQYESQTGYLMALGFGLVSDERKPKVLDNLLRQIEKADNHLRTGFLGTPLLAPVLDGNGYSHKMIEILFKETYPSWFYSINQGATTMWERWDSFTRENGFNPGGMNSFNHYAYGAIGQWMYERLAGLQPLEAGYKKIRIAPLTDGPLNYAKAEYNSIYGLIRSEWTKSDDGLELNVVIPANTSAIIEIPLAKKKNVFKDGIPLSEVKGLTVLEIDVSVQRLEVGAGSYTFTIK